jgi:hypothetical protein
LVKCGSMCNSRLQWIMWSIIRICNIINNLINYIISIVWMCLLWLDVCVALVKVNWNQKRVFSYVM